MDAMKYNPNRRYRAIQIPTRDARRTLDRNLEAAQETMAISMVDVPTLVHYMLDQWIVNHIDEALAIAYGEDPDYMPYHTAVMDFIDQEARIRQDAQHTEYMKMVLAAVWEFVLFSIVPVLKDEHLTQQELTGTHVETWINGDVIIRFGSLK